MKKPGLKTPTYDATKDGNVFHWIIETARDYRKLRQRERYITLTKVKDTRDPKISFKEFYCE